MLQRNLVYTGVTHGKDLGATIVEFFVVPAPRAATEATSGWAPA
jgi:hypothetical protein